MSTWGITRWSEEVRLGLLQPGVGGPGAEVNWGFLVLVSLAYISLVFFGVRFMENRDPVQKRIFEWMIVYNVTQALLNLRLAVALLFEVWKLGYPVPWGNALDVSEKAHGLGMLIWFQYHCRQLDLLDTLFMILRKKFQRISLVHVYLRLMNLWGWFLAARFACGGDTYFPAVVHAMCQVVVHTYYVIHSVNPSGAPLFRRARVAEVQVLQFVIVAAHAAFVLFYGNVPRSLAAFNLFFMMISLTFYIDFDGEHSRLGPRTGNLYHPRGYGKEKVTICFDSSGWLYCYHFGVAKWIQEHMIPEGITPEEAETDRFPKGLAFSGSSGGALVGGALASAIRVKDLFEHILSIQPLCRRNLWRIFVEMEGALEKFLPPNAEKTLCGRLRILLTRVSTTAPFVTGEVVDQYRDRNEAIHTLRATCHVPGVFLFPYRLGNRSYFDGLGWSTFFVPWYSDDSHTVRVSAVSRPLTDIRAPLVPLWWALFAPQPDVLRGMFWTGYSDAARFFSEQPEGLVERCKCRPDMARLDKQKVVRHLILKEPSGKLPEFDDVTGQNVADLIRLFHRSAERNLIVMLLLLHAVAFLSVVIGFYL
eukprot:CAMPEP_0197690132 /NCGR_PEP_ID=MMETSP1338-20131121/107911_1 /TAXON_ID=43686 ORGANISM="Pelagodinium beii, Strain RCC1491" /NCGR_SAMPLE_ID=MMETSP1338 /ASSEMBLY_ACC=CAM_ASM_000754 /LENGTH=589 /DNA_ID=CAMNT_0043272547 /DNA_START=239 /DNA_END=2008 /DNA_ORIENTATION=-